MEMAFSVSHPITLNKRAKGHKQLLYNRHGKIPVIHVGYACVVPFLNKQVGIDLGFKSMVITSDGHTHGNPRFFAKDEKKLATAQRRHAKKRGVPRTAIRPVSRSRASMPGL